MNISAKGYCDWVGGVPSLGPGEHQEPRQNVLGEERGVTPQSQARRMVFVVE